MQAKVDTYFLSDPIVIVKHEINDDRMHRLIIRERTYGKGNSIETMWYEYEEVIIVPDERTPDYRRVCICAATEHWPALPRVFRIITAEKV